MYRRLETILGSTGSMSEELNANFPFAAKTWGTVDYRVEDIKLWEKFTFVYRIT